MSNPVSGSAASSASRRQDEMKNMFGSSASSGGGMSVKDRMKAFNNNNTVNFDPVHFAVNQNKSKKGEFCCGILWGDVCYVIWGN